MVVGKAVGRAVEGTPVGHKEGFAVVGASVVSLGAIEGSSVGVSVGPRVGLSVGVDVGC